MKYSNCLKNEYWMYNQVYKIYKNKEKTLEHLFKANGKTFQIEWQLKLLEEDMQGNILHVFFKTNKLKDFLINTPIKDYDNFHQFLIDNGTLKDRSINRTPIRRKGAIDDRARNCKRIRGYSRWYENA
ncbi:MAG: hypothetical protein BKP49_05140 [Treponema sp. CETP13]|nr:MAG: hypothetical protein BKP49_05140 [Treponema sp. CETP13]